MIGIITRTSNRPNYFKRCAESLKDQPNVGKHYVLYDNPKDKSYILPNKITHFVDKKNYKKNYKAPAPPTARPPMLSLHNLYFNEIYSKVEEDWLYHLDDDNFLVPQAFKGLDPYLKSNVDLIICRIKHFTGKLPREGDWRSRRIRVCGIDTGCFIVRTNLIKKIKWDGWKCGDFRMIEKCSQLSRKVLWIDREVLVMEKQNLAKLNDL
jgi:hypothetical protein